jgi:hypothetical protein
METFLSHADALTKLKTADPFCLVQISTRIGKYLGKPLYRTSSIVVHEVSDDGGIAAQVKMTYKSKSIVDPDGTYTPTLAQCIAFIMAKHW